MLDLKSLSGFSDRPEILAATGENNLGDTGTGAQAENRPRQG